MNASELFDGADDFLSHTLLCADRRVPPCTSTLTDGTRLDRLGLGALQLTPAQGASKHRLVISAGIHGNETAPIEIVNLLVKAILGGNLTVRVPTLILLGNPWAMVHGVREREHNLNRLFNGRHQAAGIRDSKEGQRAQQLEQWVLAFVSSTAEPSVRHYDLHTAMRASMRERFAVYPFLPGRQLSEAEKAFLDAGDIHTVLIQQESAGTFSAFSAENFRAESFTIELGKALPFGQNDLSRFAGIHRSLARVLEGESPQGQAERVESFRVAYEIINMGDGFILNIPDDVPNFTEYRENSLIWHNAKTEYRVRGAPHYIVFPNKLVGPGQRAGLLVTKDA